MIRPHKLLVLLLVAGLMGCGKKVTAPIPGWVETSNPGALVQALAVSGTSLIAGTDRGVFRSTDNASSWTAVMPGYHVWSLAVSGTSLFAGTHGHVEFTSGGVFRSMDNGRSWAPVNNGLTVDQPWRYVNINGLAASGTSLFAATDAGVFRSTDNGESWAAVNNGLDTTDVRRVEVSGTSVFAMTNLWRDTENLTQVFRSTDNGENWTAVNLGLAAERLFVMGGSSTSLFLAAEVCEGTPPVCAWQVFRSADNGASWMAADNVPTPSTFGGILASGTSLFVANFPWGVCRSTDDGVNWTPINEGLPSLIPQAIVHLEVSGTSLFASSHFGAEYRFWRRSL